MKLLPWTFNTHWLFLLILLGLSIASCMPTRTEPLAYGGTLPTSPVLDPNKPTVAVVLGKDQTEITDVIAPYVAFKTAGIFNVVLVAEQRQPVALSGGLNVIPHYSFAQLDRELGRGPDLIIVPNIPDIRANEAARLWVQQHGRGESLVMSVCAGAAMLAATGLLDGQAATTHWGDILWIAPSYPKVKWVRGLRYVDSGQVISTAGILSGLDASLHLIARLGSKTLAQQVADKLHYPSQYLDNPSMVQFDFGLQDAWFVLKFMTTWGRPTLGVALLDGVDEMELAAMYDVYVPWLGQLVGIAPSGIITGKYGLHLIAQRSPEQWDASNEVMLPGMDSDQQPDWLSGFHLAPTQTQKDQFAFEAALQHLAHSYDVPTAQYTAKRLEYRWFVP